jgi:hypothetical protein
MKEFSKKLLSTVLTLGVVLGYSCLASAKDNTAITTINSTDKAGIQLTINDFFNIEKESLLNENLIDSSKITTNEELRKSYNAENKFNILWDQKLNEKITSYNYNIKYDSFQLKNGNCIVNARRDRSIVSNNFPGIVQESSDEKFSFVLGKKDNNWYIDSYANSEDDGFDKGQVSLEAVKPQVTNERSSKWEQNLQNIDKLVSDFKNITLNKDKDKDKNKNKNKNNNSSISLAQYSGYNGMNASEYAQKWANSFNPYYRDFTDQGGDCTNFASQAIHAGGVPYGLSWQPYTTAWVRVSTLRDYLVINNYGTEFPYVPYDYVGQLIQFYNPNYGDWHHSGILTYYSSNGDYLYCCHTYPKKNWPLSRVFPGTYSKIRVFRVYS